MQQFGLKVVVTSLVICSLELTDLGTQVFYQIRELLSGKTGKQGKKKTLKCLVTKPR